MPIPPLTQKAVFDIADWDLDAEFAVFPQGARAKEAVFAPDQPADEVLVPGKRYLFKRSQRRYPDQFWGEIIAYRVGCLMGVPVPPAFSAWNSDTGICGALIEWFYRDGKEFFILGGDFLQRIQPDLDRKYGQQHNMEHIVLLMRTLAQQKIMKTNWRQWWVDALLFDALIGNTDRHQDNWGLVFGHNICSLSPLFDNGTSLGHERFPDHIRHWHDEYYDKYIGAGTHHVKWSLTDPIINGHRSLLEKVLSEWPETQNTAYARLDFSETELSRSIEDLQSLNAQCPFTRERMSFVLKLLSRRRLLLTKLFR
jgi:hypothetical protein